MASTPQALEVHLEEVGHHSWWKSVLNVLGGTTGSAQVRFVARPAGEPDRGTTDHLLGATFPVMRAQDLDDRSRPNAWIELAEQRLDELDWQLVEDGWTRSPGPGPHWWSRTYTRIGTHAQR
jgi:hypothetical protein